MKSRWIWVFGILFLLTGIPAFSAHAKGVGLPSQFSTCDGKLFKGAQDREFINYDIALRNYLAKRIVKRFGIFLDPKIFSGFDLLEIESLFKCKKSGEPFNLFLKMFPKSP